jgi:uncharacterized damage-inducible protein DinB
MVDVATIRTTLHYSDWANDQLLRAAGGLTDGQLDQPFEMGLGSLRRTLLHIWAGESVWLERWKGKAETPWPDESERVSIAALAERFRDTWKQRTAWLETVATTKLTESVVYRDSKGSRFSATLGDMMLQMCLHSHHHRAQAVNMFRRLGAAAPELDYMYHVRRSA